MQSLQKLKKEESKSSNDLLLSPKDSEGEVEDMKIIKPHQIYNTSKKIQKCY